MAKIELHFTLPSRFLDLHGQREGFIVLAAFLLSFLFIRTSARLIRSPKVPWWPGSVTTGSGLHIHHLVWGIVLLLLSGFLAFALAPASPWIEILAALFGVGAGFTLDEFALWVHLDDVYWSKEGRASLDAVVVAALFAALVLLGLGPFDVNDTTAAETLALVLAVDVTFCVLAILKGKPFLGMIGMFVLVTSIVGAIRLASPTSPWARRRYPAGCRRLARSQARFARVRARRKRLLDAIGGSVGQPAASPAPDRADEGGAT